MTSPVGWLPEAEDPLLLQLRERAVELGVAPPGWAVRRSGVGAPTAPAAGPPGRARVPLPEPGGWARWVRRSGAHLPGARERAHPGPASPSGSWPRVGKPLPVGAGQTPLQSGPAVLSRSVRSSWGSGSALGSGHPATRSRSAICCPSPGKADRSGLRVTPSQALHVPPSQSLCRPSALSSPRPPTWPVCSLNCPQPPPALRRATPMASGTLKRSQQPQLLSSQTSSLIFGPGTGKLLGAAYSLAGISSQHLQLFPAHPGTSGGKEGGRQGGRKAHTLPSTMGSPSDVLSTCPGNWLPTEPASPPSTVWVLAPGWSGNASRAHLV